MIFFHTLQWRITLAYTALIVVSLGLVSLYLIGLVQNTYVSNLEERLEQQAHLVGESVSHFVPEFESSEKLNTISQRSAEIIGARVTLIAINGDILADTWRQPETMESHGTRPEFKDAIRVGLGKTTRISHTVGQELLYIAVPMKIDGNAVGAIRLAVPTQLIRDSVNQIILTVVFSAVVVSLLAIGLGYFIARRSSRSVRTVAEAARRVADGELDLRVEALASDETQDLANAFNQMADSLKDIIGHLSDERNRLSTTLDTMADGIIVIREVFYLRQGEGRIELVNSAAIQMLELGSSNLIEHRFQETVRDLGLQAVVTKSLQTRQQQHAEVELTYNKRYISVVATPLARENSAGVLLTLHDLTRIRDADAMRTQFVSNVSHELRSPLASIKAMVETLADGAIQEERTAVDFIHRIHSDVDRMGAIVEDLLLLSRLENEQAPLELDSTDIKLLIREVVQEFETRSEYSAIKIEVDLPDALPTVVGDKDRLRQVLSNLVDNGLKFSEPNGVVTLSATRVDSLVEISVSDTGIGIAEEFQPHIFERFYRVDNSRRYQGTGLGLAIAKHIVQAHGGELFVNSEIEKGSTFSFTISISH